MSLENILTRCKTIHAAITGVTTAYDHTDVPETLQSGNLPAVLPAGATGEMSYYAAGGARTDHEITFYLYVAPRARAPLSQQLEDVVPFVKLFRDAYAAAFKLNSLSDVEHTMLHHYVLTGDLQFEPDVFYTGIIFSLRVTEKEAVTVDL